MKEISSQASEYTEVKIHFRVNMYARTIECFNWIIGNKYTHDPIVEQELKRYTFCGHT